MILIISIHQTPNMMIDEAVMMVKGCGLEDDYNGFYDSLTLLFLGRFGLVLRISFYTPPQQDIFIITDDDRRRISNCPTTRDDKMLSIVRSKKIASAGMPI